MSNVFMQQLFSLWNDVPSIFRAAPFWSWNSKLDPDRLCRQIESMNTSRFGGFFMHSRSGLKTEYLGEEWFKCIAACVEKARQTGMKAYLYDEDRWPSADAGGIITRKFEYCRHRYLAACNPDVANQKLDKPEDRIGLFAVEFNKNDVMKSYRDYETSAINEGGKKIAFDVRIQKPTAWENDGTYLDTLNADAVAELIRSTHEVYAGKHGGDFGGVIPAIFTDEPNFGRGCRGEVGREICIPWTAKLPEEFKKCHGYDIVPFLPELVFNFINEEFSKARYDFYRTVTRLFVDNFTKQVGDWCSNNKLSLTGHVFFESALHDQIGAVGACMQHYEYMQWPGIDMLGEDCELGTVKQCSSVAAQLGKERVLSELYGCTGWDWPLEGHKFQADWQFATGINFLCPHLSHYSLAGAAKRDYPASILDHSPWWKYYNVVQDYLGRVSLMLTLGQPIRDVLVIHPVESAMGLFTYAKQTPLFESIQQGFDSIIHTMTEQHYDWDFADEHLLAKYGSMQSDDLAVGKMKYKLVIVPPAITLRSSTIALLRKFINVGGKVLCVGLPASRIDGNKVDEIDILKSCSKCSVEKSAIIEGVESLLDRSVSIIEGDQEQSCVWTMLRKVDDWHMLFAQSHDRKNAHTVKVRVRGANGTVVLWDPLTGLKNKIKAESGFDAICFDLEMESSGSALVTIGLDVTEARENLKMATVVKCNKVGGPFEIELTEPNCLPLDYCRYKYDSDKFSEQLPTLKVDELIRKRFGLKPRVGWEQQPWYLYATGVVDTKSRGLMQMSFNFHVTSIPDHCSLVIENPQNYKITVNGCKVEHVDGFWIDEDFKTIDISRQINEGINEILLSFDYRCDIELEDLYLVGSFGVDRLNNGMPHTADNMTLISLPKKIGVGSWVGQKLDFYGGAVNYKFKVGRPENGQRLQIKIPDVVCTALAIHVNGKSFVLPWAPFCADITNALLFKENEISIEIIGGRKNILGPLHTPNGLGTTPDDFSPNHIQWTNEYHLNNHGLMGPVVIEILE